MGRVKSRVIVGQDEDVEKVAKAELEVDDDDDDNEEKRVEFKSVVPCELVVEPTSNMSNAADVVEAMGMAAGGRA